MKIVSWNVNSIKARLEHVKRYLIEQAPDILMVQELKGLEFPYEEFENIGYFSYAATQKSYNGVAIISKYQIDIVKENLCFVDGIEDDHARYLEADINGARIINIYLPNGNPVDSDKYSYKIDWMEGLYLRLRELREGDIEFILGGDFNVIPEDVDCYDPQKWEGDALFSLQVRRYFRSFINLGLFDAFRVVNSSAHQYTFWDYQNGAWQKGDGIRIDHFLLSPVMCDRLVSCTIDKTPRGWNKPSDHTPIEILLK